MLNFRNTNIFFIVLLMVFVVLYLLYAIPVVVLPCLLIAYSLVVFYGCSTIGSNFFIKIICAASTSANEIAISFDDGPAENFTPAILSILKQEEVNASFFCIGKHIMGHEKILKQIADEGHLLGNHSYSHHFWFDLFTSNKMLKDLQSMDAELEKVVGRKPLFFRPPYGVMNPNLKKAIVMGGYTPIGWSVRSLDTVAKNEEKLLGKLAKSLKPGAVFLFHDTCKITVDILPRFLAHVKKSGFKVVPLDKLLHLNPYA